MDFWISWILKISLVLISLKIRDSRNWLSAPTARHFYTIGPNDVTRRRPFRQSPQKDGTCWPTTEIGPTLYSPNYTHDVSAKCFFESTMRPMIYSIKTSFDLLSHPNWSGSNALSASALLCVNLADFPPYTENIYQMQRVLQSFQQN